MTGGGAPAAIRRVAGALRRISIAAVAVTAVVSLAACGGGEVENPELLSASVPIEYPLELWDRGVEGRTILRVRVDEAGRVDSVVVLESSGYPAFDSAATRGARALEFRPARRAGEPARVWAEVPVQFSRDSTPDGTAGAEPAPPSDTAEGETPADGPPDPR